jgi:LuxR family maltose regulon positive regulatory protein
VAAWLDSLPSDVVEDDRRLASARAWLALDLGRLDEAARWIELAERAGEEIDAQTALLSAVCRFKLGELGRARADALRASELAGDRPSFEHAVAFCLTGVILHWTGDDADAERTLSGALELLRTGRNELGAAYALGYLALIAAQRDALERAEELAEAALAEGDDPGFSEHFVLTIAHLARAELLKRRGSLIEAEMAAARAYELSRRGAGRLEMAVALLALAEARHSAGEPGEARELLDRAAALVEASADPGVIGEMVEDANRRLASRRRARAPELRDELSDRELAVLRLLPTALSQREIGGELFVSLNTVKTHLRNIYRKLGVDGRDEAVERARALGLL